MSAVGSSSQNKDTVVPVLLIRPGFGHHYFNYNCVQVFVRSTSAHQGETVTDAELETGNGRQTILYLQRTAII